MLETVEISERALEIATELVHATGEKRVDIIEKALVSYQRNWLVEQVARTLDELTEQAKSEVQRPDLP